LLTAALPLLPSPTSAQGSGDGFLFKQPDFQLGVVGGYTMARAGGTVLDRVREDFTLRKRDFDASSWGFQLSIRGSKRLDLALDVRFSRSEVGSESRPYVDLDDLPIEQTTTFIRVPITVSTKYYLRDRGRAVSQFAWIPETWSPFVGVGGGVQWYQLEQAGDFVEEPSLDVLSLTIESSGAVPTAHVFAGMEISISPRFLWTLEGRYGFGRAKTGVAFGFDNLDLSGFQATIGLAARF
jgi:hypothetical protein